MWYDNILFVFIINNEWSIFQKLKKLHETEHWKYGRLRQNWEDWRRHVIRYLKLKKKIYIFKKYIFSNDYWTKHLLGPSSKTFPYHFQSNQEFSQKHIFYLGCSSKQNPQTSLNPVEICYCLMELVNDWHGALHAC